MRRSVCLLAGLILFAPTVRAEDPLDRVTGTEGWSQAGPESPAREWRDWYRARVAWRRGGRELRLQRVINQRLARLPLHSPERLAEARRIIESGSVSGEASTPPDVAVERLDEHGRAVDDELDLGPAGKGSTAPPVDRRNR